MSNFQKFLIQVVLATVLLIGLQNMIFLFVLERPMTLPYWLLYPWFIFLTIVVHYFLVKAGEKDPKKFVPVFMGSIGLKMFACLGVLMIFVYKNPDEVAPFAVSFVFLYMAYTVVEVIAVLKVLKNTK